MTSPCAPGLVSYYYNQCLESQPHTLHRHLYMNSEDVHLFTGQIFADKGTDK